MSYTVTTSSGVYQCQASTGFRISELSVQYHAYEQEDQVITWVEKGDQNSGTGTKLRRTSTG